MSEHSSQSYDKRAADAIDEAAEHIEALASEASYRGTEAEVSALLEMAADVRSLVHGGRVVRSR